MADGNEECAYLAHPLLNAWLREITNVILQHSVKEVKEVTGSRIDSLKFCSSMTLFDAVCPNDIFRKVLVPFFDGERDSFILQRIRK
ncbi:DUF1810 family protein [Prevotella pallens]|uniref:DUF1810 family protein n=1 Tax=Prevotella pallens TaxID=60133 RepID=UPI0035CED8E4